MSATAPAPRLSAMNVVILLFFFTAILAAAFTGKMQAITDASFQAAKDAVTLALGLVGIMAFWLGMMRILEAGGLTAKLAISLRPIVKRLFPEIPEEHPALSSMLLNFAANLLGLGNAATPFGLRAMAEFNKLNPIPGTATNAMCLFLAINTSHITLLPLGVIGVRAAAGAHDPAAIVVPTLLATSASTAVGIIAAMLFAKLDWRYREQCAKSTAAIAASVEETPKEVPKEDYSHLLIPPSQKMRYLMLALVALFGGALAFQIYQSPDRGAFLGRDFLSFWLMPLLMFAILTYGLSRGVKVYEALTEGGKQGFDIALKIIPFLVAILVAIAMFRASGAMDALAYVLRPISSPFGIPPEAVPMAIVRPLSGNGAFGIMSALIKEAPDSYSAFVASVMMGASDTTFYILAVYFGSIGIVRIRHALIAGLLAETAGMLVAGIASSYWWQPA